MVAKTAEHIIFHLGDSMTDHAVTAGLDAIRARFLGVLNERLDRMEMHGMDLGDPATRLPALQAIGADAHKLAGTAATLGYPELGAMARSVDVTILEILSSNGAETAPRQTDAAIDALMDKIFEVLEDQPTSFDQSESA